MPRTVQALGAQRRAALYPEEGRVELRRCHLWASVPAGASTRRRLCIRFFRRSLKLEARAREDVIGIIIIMVDGKGARAREIRTGSTVRGDFTRAIPLFCVGHDDDDDADHAPSRPVSLSPTSLSFSGSLEDSWKIRREFRCFSDAGADGDAGPQWVAESLCLSSSSSSSWLGPLSSDPSKSRGGSGGQSQALLLDKCRSFVGFVHGAGSRNVRPIPRTARARCAFPAFECSERRSEERWPLQMCVRRAIVSS